MIKLGKLVYGKITYIPDVHAFGGCIFINWLKYSLMIAVPDPIVNFLGFFGIDLIGD